MLAASSPQNQLHTQNKPLTHGDEEIGMVGFGLRWSGSLQGIQKD